MIVSAKQQESRFYSYRARTYLLLFIYIYIYIYLYIVYYAVGNLFTCCGRKDIGSSTYITAVAEVIVAAVVVCLNDRKVVKYMVYIIYYT